MKNFKFPTPYSVLMLVIVFSAMLTYILPSGRYDTLEYNAEQKAFVVKTNDNVETIPASQEVLQKYGIGIDVKKFEEGKIKKPVYIPNTYKEAEAQQQGITDIIFAPIKGIYETIDVILFVLVLGGFIGVFNSSGTLNEGVGYLTYRLKGREGILIIVLSGLISLGGTSFGLAEETFAFYPILVPVFLAAGYDLMVPLAVIYVGSAMGTMASTVNPFAVIIASDSVGVDWTMGLESRLLLLVLGMTISVIYIIRYAERVRKNPESSVVYGTPIPKVFMSQKSEEVKELKFSTKMLLIVFGLSFVVMIVGVSQWDWWFQEMTATFLVASIIIALLQRTSEENFIENFIAGARDLVGVAFIIGIARGVTFILNDGQIADTILYYCSNLVEGMHPALFLVVLMFVFFILTLFISSSSGMAVVTMPIMGALASVIGVEGQSVVNAYLLGMGLMSFITPTGFILPSLAMVNLNYNQWIKFSFPLVVMLTILGIAILLGEYYF